MRQENTKHREYAKQRNRGSFSDQPKPQLHQWALKATSIQDTLFSRMFSGGALSQAQLGELFEDIANEYLDLSEEIRVTMLKSRIQSQIPEKQAE